MEIPQHNIGLLREQIDQLLRMHDLTVDRYRGAYHPLRGNDMSGLGPHRIGLTSPLPLQSGFAFRSVAADHLIINGKTDRGEDAALICPVISLDQITKLKDFLDARNEEYNQQHFGQVSSEGAHSDEPSR